MLMRHTAPMRTSVSRYHRHRFPVEIISHCVWLYFRFTLSLRGVEDVQRKYQNNRAENSHEPTRLRERVMRRFKSAGHAQRFLSAFGIITSHFRVGRHHYRARGYREVMESRFVTWKEVIGAHP